MAASLLPPRPPPAPLPVQSLQPELDPQLGRDRSEVQHASGAHALRLPARRRRAHREQRGPGPGRGLPRRALRHAASRRVTLHAAGHAVALAWHQASGHDAPGVPSAAATSRRADAQDAEGLPRETRADARQSERRLPLPQSLRAQAAQRYPRRRCRCRCCRLLACRFVSFFPFLCLP